MSRGLNKVMIIGNLGRDPEMRYTPGGRPVTSFSVVTSRSWVSAEGERREEHEWFNVVAWGNLAEICKSHLKKDQQVYVEGRLQTRGWEDDEGKRHFRTELVANEMIVLGDRRGVGEYEENNENEEDDGNYAFYRAPSHTNKESSSVSNYDRDDDAGGRGPGRFGPRRAKICNFCAEKVKHVDYKDPDLLRRYLTDRGKIRPRRQTGTCAKHQRSLRTAVIRARHLALLPFTASHIRGD